MYGEIGTLRWRDKLKIGPKESGINQKLIAAQTKCKETLLRFFYFMKRLVFTSCSMSPEAIPTVYLFSIGVPVFSFIVLVFIDLLIDIFYN